MGRRDGPRATRVLEQFRIFQAALRLGQFTTKQLAEASGVAMGTVQKTLRRHEELFLDMPSKQAKGRGGQSRLRSVRAELLRAALQREADRPVLPPMPVAQDGSPLGLLLARETLCTI